MTSAVVAFGCLPLLLGAALASITTASVAGAAPMTTGTRYHLEVTLDVASHTIDGKETILWRNQSEGPISELWFHLFQNAFRDNQSLFMRQPAELRRSKGSLGTTGGIEISQMSSPSFPDVALLSAMESHSPGDETDRTDIALRLPRPIAPGETIELTIAFQTRLPLMVERSGYSGKFLAVTQWFPKLSRHDPDGTFHHFAYHPLSEFAGEFADYEVAIEADHAYQIAAPAPGVPQAAPPGRRRESFQVSDVTDFAWFASDRFHVASETIAGIDVRLFFPPGHEANAQLSLETLRFGLGHLQTWLGPYPYPTLTVVHPPDDARPASAMEYPRLFTTGGPWFLAHLPVHALRSVVLHELSHQWFQGIIANDEVRYPLLDEGLASFAESEMLTASFQDGSGLPLFPLRVSDRVLRRSVSLLGTHRGALALPAQKFGTFPELSRRVYGRAVTLLQTVGNAWGPSRLSSAIASYARATAFTHPTPEVLLSFIEHGVGTPAATALRTAFDADGWVDFALPPVTSDPIPGPTGTPPRFRHRVTVQRHGNLVFPVTIRLTLRDGQSVTRVWDGNGDAVTIVLEGAELLEAIVDPEHQILIDDDWTNQRFQRNRPAFPLRTWTAITAIATMITGGLGT